MRNSARKTRTALRWACALLLMGPAAEAYAVDEERELETLSIEELMDVEVTSVAKREQSLASAPAAITVISREDIRRSGMSSVPELLRMVPGLHVARSSANTWAITSRGFNGQFANKLLVLIDGRSVYTPLFSGVYWDVQDPMLEDIERIEVIRGPGGTLWGANAVNGVINIITRSARDTQGLLVASSAGTVERAAGRTRWGGSLGGNVFYRANIQYLNIDDFDDGPQAPAHDAWDKLSGGARFDWNLSEDDSLTFQGDYYNGETRQTALNGSRSSTDISGGNVLARWVHTFSDRSDLRVQAYYDRTERDSALTDEDRDTADLEVQHRFSPLSGHNLVWGAGYRFTTDDIGSSATISFTPSHRSDHLFSFFLQDEIEVLPEQLRLTLGSKFERNDYTGFEFQPSGRLLWAPHPRHRVWAAVSRAVRTPSRAEDDVALFVPVNATTLQLLQGTRQLDSEKVLAYELGYRAQALDDVSVDLALYLNDYEDLRSLEPGAPIPNFPAPGLTTFPASGANRIDGLGYGVELLTTWNATDSLSLTTGYTLMKLELDRGRLSGDPSVNGQEKDTPSHQVQFRPRLSLPWNLELDPTLFYVGEVQNQGVDDYVRVDVRVGWRPIEGVELSVVGQNLADGSHLEYGPSFTSLPTRVPRGMYAKVVWNR